MPAVLLVAGLKSRRTWVGPVFLALVLTVAAHLLRTHLLRRGLPGWVAGLAMMLVIYPDWPWWSRCCSAVPSSRLVPEYESEGGARGRQQTCRQPGQHVQLDLGRLVDAVAGLVDADDLDSPGRDGGLLHDPRRTGSPSVSGPAAAPKAEALGLFASGTRRYLVVSTVFGLIVAVFDTLALVWIGVPGRPCGAARVRHQLRAEHRLRDRHRAAGRPRAAGGRARDGADHRDRLRRHQHGDPIHDPAQDRRKRVVGLSGTVTMLSLVFWAFTLGAIGALMAVPLTLLVKALIVDADPALAGPLLTAHEPDYRDRVSQWREGSTKRVRSGLDPAVTSSRAYLGRASGVGAPLVVGLDGRGQRREVVLADPPAGRPARAREVLLEPGQREHDALVGSRARTRASRAVMSVPTIASVLSTNHATGVGDSLTAARARRGSPRRWRRSGESR